MRNYRNYDVWEKAHNLVLFIYREILICFPATEQRDLMSQMKRAAYSVPFNFVEGCGRNTDKISRIFWIIHSDRCRNWNIQAYWRMTLNISVTKNINAWN